MIKTDLETTDSGADRDDYSCFESEIIADPNKLQYKYDTDYAQGKLRNSLWRDLLGKQPEFASSGLVLAETQLIVDLLLLVDIEEAEAQFRKGRLPPEVVIAFAEALDSQTSLRLIEVVNDNS